MKVRAWRRESERRPVEVVSQTVEHLAEDAIHRSFARAEQVAGLFGRVIAPADFDPNLRTLVVFAPGRNSQVPSGQDRDGLMQGRETREACRGLGNQRADR